MATMLPIRKLTDSTGAKYYPLVAGECVLTTSSIVAKADIGGYKKDDIIEKATPIFNIIKKLFDGVPVVIDTELSTTSSNAVENKAIATKVAAMDTIIDDNLLSKLSLNYNSTTSEKKIELKGKDGAVLSSIDASAFVKDGFLESVTLVGKKLKFVFNTDAGKQDIEVNLSSLGIIVDSELKDNSINPVQNKVIKAAIDSKVTSVIGEAKIFNESDGGGAMYESASTGIKSFVGVNDPASSGGIAGIAGQLYVVNGDQKTKLNMYDGKFCYVKGANPVDDSDKEKRELVVKENLDTKVDKVEGKQLSSEDFTTELKTKLEDITPFDPSTLDDKFDSKLNANDTYKNISTIFAGLNYQAKEGTANLPAIIEEMISRFGGNLNKISVKNALEFKNALNVAKTTGLNYEITLMADINLDGLVARDSDPKNIIPDITHSMVIDLNGYTIKSTKVYTTSGNRILRAKNEDGTTNGIDLVIKNGKFECSWLSDTWTGPVGPVRIDSPNGSLTMNDVEFTCNGGDGNSYCGVKIDNAKSCLLTNVTGTAIGQIGCFCNECANCVAILKNCNFTTDYNYIQSASYYKNFCSVAVGVGCGGKIIINGGKYTNIQGIAALNIWQSGGTIEVNQYATIESIVKYATSPAGACFNIENYKSDGEDPVSGSKLILNSAKVIMPDSDTKMILTVVNDASIKKSDCEICIDGGVYNKFDIMKHSGYDYTVPVKIDSGTFDKDVTGLTGVEIDITKICNYDAEYGMWIIIKKEKHIKNVTDLLNLKAEIDSGDSKNGWTYYQDVDLDMTGNIWIGMGGVKGNNPFMGTYDGCNHSIYNLLFSRDTDGINYNGLFRSTKGATIRNLTVEVGTRVVDPVTGDITYTGNGFGPMGTGVTEFGAAALIGCASFTNIENITTKGVMGTADDPVLHNVAGIIVRNTAVNNDTFYATNCNNYINMNTTYTKAGGLVAFENADTMNGHVYFTNCNNYGTIAVNRNKPSVGTTAFGGLIGWTTAYGSVGNWTTFTDCNNYGELNVTYTESFTGDNTIGQFIGYANGYIELRGINTINNNSTAIKYTSAIGAGQGVGDHWSIAYGIVTDNRITVINNIKNIENNGSYKVNCASCNEHASIHMVYGKILTFDCTIGQPNLIVPAGYVLVTENLGNDVFRFHSEPES